MQFLLRGFTIVGLIIFVLLDCSVFAAVQNQRIQNRKEIVSGLFNVVEITTAQLHHQHPVKIGY